MNTWKNFASNKTAGKRRTSKSLCVELFGGVYYLNGRVPVVHLDSALEMAFKRLPKVATMRVYVRPGVVYMHQHKPSPLYTEVSTERMPTAQAWELFVMHARMLV